jgi:Cu2+-exporting ATPase
VDTLKNKKNHQPNMKYDHGEITHKTESSSTQEHHMMDHSMVPENNSGHETHSGIEEHSGHEKHSEHKKHSGHEEHAGHEQHSGHDGHTGHVDHGGHEQMFRKRFWVSLILTIPVLLFSQSVQNWLGFRMPEFTGSDWIVPVFSTIIFLYGGIPFIKMAIPELRNKRPGMMALISLAISVSFLYSVTTTFFPLGESFYWELVTLIVVMLFGHWMEMRSVRKASSALDELAKLMPDTAGLILKNGRIKTVQTADLKNDNLILIRPGESIPADGVVIEGKSDVNEALITGESKPVKKSPGSTVIAGSINEVGSLRQPLEIRQH